MTKVDYQAWSKCYCCRYIIWSNSSDFDGKFTLTVSQNPPFTVQVSSVGFETSTQEITENNQEITVALKEGSVLDEVVISASRTPERIFESPVTVERFGIKRNQKIQHQLILWWA